MDATTQQTQQSEQPKKAPPRTLAEHLVAASNSGNLQTAFEAILAAAPGDMDLNSAYFHLREALHGAGAKTPQKFSDTLYLQMLKFNAYVTLRLQLAASRSFRELDTTTAAGKETWPSELAPVMEELRKMTELTTRLMHSWAATRRLWELGRRKRKPRSRNREPFEELFN